MMILWTGTWKDHKKWLKAQKVDFMESHSGPYNINIKLPGLKSLICFIGSNKTNRE